MKTNEIIVYRISKNIYTKLVYESFRYAILSLPFTINRMDYNKLTARIQNILKGKLAEKLLKNFLTSQNISVNFACCETPYYKIDKNDFILNDMEFDLKNNFVYCNNITYLDILEFLALIPDRHSKDQWSKRNEVFFPNLAQKGKAYLFTFMLKRRYDIIISLSERLIELLKKYINIYKGEPQNFIPLDYEEDIKKLLHSHKLSNFIKINIYSPIIITGYATKDHFNLFRHYGVGTKFTENKNCFTSRIVNKGVKIKYLPSFKSLIINNKN